MFITIHAATGALVGTEVGNPFLAFLLGFFLHFVLDIIPHGDCEMGKKFWGLLNKRLSEEEQIRSLAAYGVIDYIALVFFIFYSVKNFFFAKDDAVIWAMIGSILPDLLVVVYMVTKSRLLRWFFDFHAIVHHWLINRMGNDISLKLGLIMQTVIFLLLFTLLYQINLFGPLIS
jgi:hypothetical protein